MRVIVTQLSTEAHYTSGTFVVGSRDMRYAGTSGGGGGRGSNNSIRVMLYYLAALAHHACSILLKSVRSQFILTLTSESIGTQTMPELGWLIN